MAQMFVSGKQESKAAGDVRNESGNRLASNGMNRSAQDRNPVQDEHDFASLRANLGKKNHKPTDEAKLQRAKEKTGLEPGAQSFSSNQMHVSGATNVQPVVESTEGETDFAALRANLGKKSGSSAKKAVKPAENVNIKSEPVKKEEEEDTNFAALRANLGKKKTAPSGQMFVGAKQEAQPVSDVRNDSRLNNNGMNRDTTDSNPVQDEHDFASLRANLGKKKPSAGSQMYVGKQEAQPVTDVRNGRLVSNGMDRNATDSNPVADEHDFAAARANLGKKNVKTDEKKVSNAKAMFEAREEPRPEPQTKVFVGKKKPAEGVNVRDQAQRLNNNGMERDRTDSNPVNDEHDFNSLRANLKRVS